MFPLNRKHTKLVNSPLYVLMIQSDTLLCMSHIKVFREKMLNYAYVVFSISRLVVRLVFAKKTVSILLDVVDEGADRHKPTQSKISC